MRHVVFILLAAVCFGTTGTAQEFGPDASALSVGAARIVIGGGALALIAWAASRALQRGSAAPSAVTPEAVITTGAIDTVRPAGRAPTWLVVALGAAGVVGYQPLFFAGTSINGVAVGTIVALGSAPILTGALEWAITRRFPGVAWLTATVVATVGVVLPTGIGGTAAISIEGLLASLAAGASYAVYAMASERLLVRVRGGRRAAEGDRWPPRVRGRGGAGGPASSPGGRCGALGRPALSSRVGLVARARGRSGLVGSRLFGPRKGGRRGAPRPGFR